MNARVRSERLLRIGGFGRRTNLSAHQLRHYHELGLLVPVLIDPESSYRYYSAAQAATAEVIAILRSVDMPLAEIRDLLRSPTRERVQEALDRQRERLEARLEAAREKLERLEQLAMEGRLMSEQGASVAAVEVAVDGVRVHTTTGQHVVVLREKEGERVLTIWVGPFEANGVAMSVQGMVPQRPLTYDFMTAAFDRLGVSVESAVITRHVDEVFYAEVHARRDGAVEVIDARPSDAINVAVRAGAPVLVSEEVMNGLAREPSPADGESGSPGVVVEATEEGTDQIVGLLHLPEMPEPGQAVPVFHPTPWLVVAIDPAGDGRPARVTVRRPKPE